MISLIRYLALRIIFSPLVLNGLDGWEYPREPFPLITATRNWYQCPVFNRSRIVTWDFVDIWRTIQELNLDSIYLGPSKCRSSTRYLTSSFSTESFVRWVFEFCQDNRIKLFFCCLICIFSGIRGKSGKIQKYGKNENL